jgi:tetratricopeptide (TPR) repeat protein
MRVLLVLLSLAAHGQAVAASPYQLNFEALEHYRAARYEQAAAGFRQALEAWAAAGPRFARDRAVAAMNLGTVLRIQGRHWEAEALLSQALRDFEAISGAESLDAGRAAGALAALHHARGSLDATEAMARRACQVFSREAGATDSDRADAAFLLASVHFDGARNSEAEAILTELVKGGESRPAMRAYNDLAAAAIRRGDLDAAESLAGRALEMGARVLPDNHPLRAAALNNLAQVHRFRERYAEAERHYREAIAVWEAALGARHPDTARGMLNLAALHHERGRERLAEDLYRRCVAIFREAYGERHELTLIARAELADVLRAERRYSESKRLSAETLPALETRLGVGDPRVVRASENYRRLLRETKQ